MTDGSKRPVGPGLLVGLWITALGVIFLLDQLGVLPAHISFEFVWPAILIAAGLGIMFYTHAGNRFWGAVLLVWGLASLSNVLGFFHIHIGSLWPLVLIALGISMLLNSSGRFGHPGWPPWPNHTSNTRIRRRTRRRQIATRNSFDDSTRPGASAGHPRRPRPRFFGVSANSGSSDDATFDQAVILSGFKRRVTSQRFRFGKAAAVLGGFHIDFTRADIDGSRAILHIDTVFGGGEVRVPDNWRISIEATAVAGAFVDETYPQPVNAATPVKELIVRGSAIFGGVNIKN